MCNSLRLCTCESVCEVLCDETEWIVNSYVIDDLDNGRICLLDESHAEGLFCLISKTGRSDIKHNERGS
jgi:hypothetical protein